MQLEIYTDGACSGNPGPGGWGAVILYPEGEQELSGFERMTTNNRMELTAVISALSSLAKSSDVTIYSDSAYIVNCWQQGWYRTWQKNGWLTSKRSPVENKDLWEQLIALSSKHNLKFIKVKGHSNVKYNNRCDELARKAIIEMLRV